MTADPSPTPDSIEERLRRRERELRAVYRITSALHARTGLDDLERQTLNTAIETVDASVGSILLYDPQKERLVFRYVVNPDPAVTEQLMTIELAESLSWRLYHTARGPQNGAGRPDPSENALKPGRERSDPGPGRDVLFQPRKQ